MSSNAELYTEVWFKQSVSNSFSISFQYAANFYFWQEFYMHGSEEILLKWNTFLSFVPSQFTWGLHKTGPWFNIKMSSYQYRKSHCGDKMVVRSSYLHNEISYAGKMASLYWISSLVSSCLSLDQCLSDFLCLTHNTLVRWEMSVLIKSALAKAKLMLLRELS